MEADEIGTAAMLLGAGRATKESEIDLAVGIVLNIKVGDSVKKGDSLATVYSNREDVQEVMDKLTQFIDIESTKKEAPPLIYEVITA